MENSNTLKTLILVTTLVIFCSAIATAVYKTTSRSQKKQGDHTYEAAEVTAAPEVVSSIEGLEIAAVSLLNKGTPEAAVVIDVINHRDEDLMAIDFIAEGKNTYGGIRMDGLLQADNPSVIIRRHSLRTFTWSLGAVIEGGPIFIGAAVFADGKEEGQKRFVDGLKKARRHYQQQDRDKKAKNGGQQ